MKRILAAAVGVVLALFSAGGWTPASAGAAQGEMFGYRLGDTYEVTDFVEIFMGNYWVKAKDPVLPEGFSSLRLLVTPISGTILGMEARGTGTMSELEILEQQMNVALFAQFGTSDVKQLILDDGTKIGPIYSKDINGHWLALQILSVSKPPMISLDFRYSNDNPEMTALNIKKKKEAERYLEQEKAKIRKKEKDRLLRGIE